MKVADIFEKILKSDASQAGPEGLVLHGIALLLKREGLASDPFSETIREFHTKFHCDYDGPPRPLPMELIWRFRFLQEELNDEYRKALAEGDLIKQYDALLDIMYVSAGTIHLMGLPVLEGWMAVHASNMSKEVTQPGEGKFGTRVKKGFGYQEPKLLDIIGLGWLEEERVVVWDLAQLNPPPLDIPHT